MDHGVIRSRFEPTSRAFWVPPAGPFETAPPIRRPFDCRPSIWRGEQAAEDERPPEALGLSVVTSRRCEPCEALVGHCETINVKRVERNFAYRRLAIASMVGFRRADFHAPAWNTNAQRPDVLAA
jgi:hypothetical protein